jgi:hypothetical protein
MDRLELHLKGWFVLLMIALGFMSCGLTPLIIWFVSVKDYPKALDAEGVMLRNGQHVPWKNLTERRKLILRTKAGRQVVTGVGLVFGKIHVKLAPRVLVEGSQIFPYLKRILGEDLSVP